MIKKITLVILAMSTFANTYSIAETQISPKNLQLLWDKPAENAVNLVSKMDIRTQIGQVLMLDFRNWGVDDQKNPINVTALPNKLANILTDYKIGSLALFRENLINTQQTYQLTQDIQKARYQLPILLGVDQEGGYVTRLREGTEMPGNMALAATRQVNLAQKTGEIHGSELSALGIHVNFAPVVDVNINQKNPIIGVRSYGSNIPLINEMANAYIKGLSTQKIIATLKHFPGHGNVATDSHVGLPLVPYSEKTWRETDLLPFQSAIANDVDMIMTAHIVFPALDNAKVISKKDQSEIGLPATLSKKILTDILRKNLNYTGLVLTDALDMGAIADNFGSNEAVAMALLAGADIAVMPLHVWDDAGLQKLENLYVYLENESVKNPELAMRIKQAATNVVTHKLKHKITSNNSISLPKAKTIVASQAHKSFEKVVAESAITLIENQQILPYALQANTSILVISDENSRNTLITKELKSIDDELNAVTIKTEGAVIKTDSTTDNAINDTNLESKIKQSDFIILASYNLTSSTNHMQNVVDLANKNSKPLVLISSRNPYDIAYLKGVKANIAIYGITGFDITNNNRNSLEANIKAGIRSLFKHEKMVFNQPKGMLPIEIKTEDDKSVLYPFGHGLSY